jgi:hypothetical protein
VFRPRVERLRQLVVDQVAAVDRARLQHHGFHLTTDGVDPVVGPRLVDRRQVDQQHGDQEDEAAHEGHAKTSAKHPYARPPPCCHAA